MFSRLYSFLLAIVVALLFSSRSQADESIKFNRDIRPILSDNCYACHGHDSGQRKAKLRLDLKEGIDRVVDRDDPELSELLMRVTSDDMEDVMPPASHRKKLSETQKRLIVDWIRQGAPWQDHWAFIAPEKNDPPVIKNSDRVNVANFIDNYVLDRLKNQNLNPSPQAERRILIRRLYFDLIGLPPTPEQVRAFVADDSADAYERVVNSLLASPHFGERMAIQWLDLVRYADTVGYHGDQDMSVSPYRDYVISAFNSNMPFDQFTREQLAGDLLNESTRDQRVASGYNRLGMMSAEGGVQPEEYLTKYAADRVRTTASVWLGITLGCAECHDHKFDSFSHKDFYRFAAFFADLKERGLYSGANSTGDWGPKIDIPDELLADLLKPIDAQLKSLRKKAKTSTPETNASQNRWLENWNANKQNWLSLKPVETKAYDEPDFLVGDDHAVLSRGPITDENVYFLTFDLPKSMKLTGLRLEALPDKSLPKKGPGRAGNGNFVVTEMLIAKGNHIARTEDLKKVHNLWPDDLKQQLISLHNSSATFEQAASAQSNPYGKWSAESAIDHDAKGPTWGWAVMPQSGRSNELVVQFQQPLDSEETRKLTVVIQQYHGTQHNLGKFRISVTSESNPKADVVKALPDDIMAIINKPKAEWSSKENERFTTYYLTIAPELESTRKQIVALEKNRAQVVKERTTTSLISVAVKPREIRVLPRGNWMDKSGEVVQPAVPAHLPQVDLDRRASRLDLAEWIMRQDNPLTARVFVNRMWKHFFGTGLSKVLDDVGSQGEWPSHPELLDALAIEFRNSGWDIKAIIKLMVMSATYRQSSQPREELAEIDPYNRLLARQARFRLDAEMIRDNALTVSGLLVNRIGGRSAKPYQPAGLYRHLNFPARKYQHDNDENQYRRGLYTHWQRQFLHPAMKTFDAPSREECTCERPRSNTPLGALLLLNDPSYVEAARKLAENTIKAETETTRRVKFIFWNALSRSPSQLEIDVVSGLLESHRKHFRENPDDATKLIEIGQSESTVDDSKELAAWTSVARAIMNMHEFITRY